MIHLTAAQRAELLWVKRCGQPAYVRPAALALLNLDAGGQGLPVSQVACFLGVSRQTVYDWCRRYQAGGVAGLRVAKGRGRKARADAAQVADYVQQSPRHFGLSQTRWTLAALVATVPSLNGFSLSGARAVLKRIGLSHKRGQPARHSPDPHYESKKKRLTTP